MCDKLRLSAWRCWSGVLKYPHPAVTRSVKEIRSIVGLGLRQLTPEGRAEEAASSGTPVRQVVLSLPAVAAPNVSGRFEQYDRSDAVIEPAASELVSGLPRFAIGTGVSYPSRTSKEVFHGAVVRYNQEGTYRLHQWETLADVTAVERVLQGGADPLRMNVWPEYPAHFQVSVEPGNTLIAKAPRPIGVLQTSFQREPPVKPLPPGLQRHIAASGIVSRANPNEPAALEVKAPPAVLTLPLRSAAPAHSESGAPPPQEFEPTPQPPPTQLVWPGAAAVPPPAAKASQADSGPPVKSPPLGPCVVVSGSSVSPGNPLGLTDLLKGPWIATAVDACLTPLEGQGAVIPEVVAHYTT